MTAVNDRQPIGGRAKRQRRAAGLDRVPRARVEGVKRDQCRERGDQLIVIRVQLLGEFAQDALDFTLLLQLELAHAIPEFHRGGRLHKNGGAGSGTVVHDAAHIAACFAAHRHDPAAVAHRDGQVANLMM